MSSRRFLYIPAVDPSNGRPTFTIVGNEEIIREVEELDLVDLICEKARRDAKTPGKRKGKPGRRGYPATALAFALALREKNPDMKAHTIRTRTVSKFGPASCPDDDDNFRRWLNRDRANRAN